MTLHVDSQPTTDHCRNEMTTIEIYRDNKQPPGSKWMCRTTRGRNRVPEICRVGVPDQMTRQEAIEETRQCNPGCIVTGETNVA